MPAPTWFPSVSAEQRALLERWVRAATTPQRVVRRSRIVLFAADGMPAAEVARAASVSLPTVRLWVRRFAGGGPEALLRDAPGRGRHARLDSAVVAARLQQPVAGGAPPSIRQLAREFGVSPSVAWRAVRKGRSAAAGSVAKPPG